MLYSAERRLSLTSPYFVPDDSLLYAVTTAAQRGVEVELFVGATADQFMVAHAQRSYYEALLTRGRADLALPRAVRAARQALLGRRQVAVVGSSNMDMRSFALNYEVVMMMTGAGDRRPALARCRTTTARCRPSSPSTSGAAAAARTAYLDNLMRLTATLQ